MRGGRGLLDGGEDGNGGEEGRRWRVMLGGSWEDMVGLVGDLVVGWLRWFRGLNKLIVDVVTWRGLRTDDVVRDEFECCLSRYRKRDC